MFDFDYKNKFNLMPAGDSDQSGDEPAGDEQEEDMASSVTVTNSVASLRTLFNKISSVYFDPATSQTPDTLTSLEFELPILEDSVTFDTGEPDVSTVNLTTGEKWTTMTTAGEPNITMQCSSFDPDILSLFLDVADSTAREMTLDSIEYSGKGYKLSAKKVTGCMILRSEDKQECIFLPNVEIYSSIGLEQDTPGYFTMNITPLANANNDAAIYFLNKTT